MRCPVGLIVTPRTLSLFADQYLSTSEDSVRRVADFDTARLILWNPSRGGKREAYEFEEAIQFWLENLTSESEFRVLPSDLAQALQAYVLPALFRGAVQAARPRPALIAG